MAYGEIIQDVAGELDLEIEEDDPRRIEAFMRIEYGTLSHLTRQKIADEIRLFLREAEHADDWRGQWDRCADTYNLEK